MFVKSATVKWVRHQSDTLHVSSVVLSHAQAFPPGTVSPERRPKCNASFIQGSLSRKRKFANKSHIDSTLMGVYEPVELIEPLLDSVDNEAIRLSAPDDRRRSDAVAISNCCLVCWCMILGEGSV